MAGRNRLDMKKPIYVGGKEATVIFTFPNGNFAVTLPGENFSRQFSGHGNPLDAHRERAANDLPITTDVVTLYPHGNVYVKGEPVQSSTYGVDQLIQVLVTRQGGIIIKKELLP